MAKNQLYNLFIFKIITNVKYYYFLTKYDLINPIINDLLFTST